MKLVFLYGPAASGKLTIAREIAKLTGFAGLPQPSHRRRGPGRLSVRIRAVRQAARAILDGDLRRGGGARPFPGLHLRARGQRRPPTSRGGWKRSWRRPAARSMFVRLAVSVAEQERRIDQSQPKRIRQAEVGGAAAGAAASVAGRATRPCPSRGSSSTPMPMGPAEAARHHRRAARLAGRLGRLRLTPLRHSRLTPPLSRTGALMTDTRLDVLAIGNAIVDVIADTDDAFLDREGLTKGSMRLIDADEATRLYDHMGPAREISGGSAGNTAAGVAALGGQRRLHRPGRRRPARRLLPPRHRARPASSSPRRAGRFRRADRALDGPGHARRPADDEHLPRRRPASAGRRRSTRQQIADAAILYLEGYLWDPETPRCAMIKAIDIARSAGRKVAFTLSDSFCIDRHRDGFNAADRRRPDRHPVRQRGRDPGARRRRRFRRGGRRGRGHRSTTAGRHPQRERRDRRRRRRARRGAGRAGRRRSSTRPAPATCSPPASSPARRRAAASSNRLRIGAIAAAEVISHYGARPEADLKALVAARLG